MLKTSSLRMTPVEWILLFILGGFWGCTFFFNEIAILELPPLSIILFRVGLASIILWIVVFASGITILRSRDVWVALGIMAAINSAIPFFLIAWGQIHITGGLASILIATSPLFAVVGAHYWTRDEGLTPGKIIGILAGLIGVVFLLGPELLGDIGSDLIGQLSVLAAAICYAGSAIYGRRFATFGVPPLFVATGQMTMATVLLVPFTLIVDQPWTLANPSLPVWGAIISLAVVSTTFAYLIYFRILANAGAINILLVNFLVPVSALLLGIFVLGETLTIEQVIGLACIVVGLVTIDGRLLSRFQLTG
ncbi:MAG: DMT family transporter [Alphaproteobacteria bacterium]